MQWIWSKKRAMYVMQSWRGGRYAFARRQPSGLSGLVGGSSPVLSGEMILGSAWAGLPLAKRAAWFHRMLESAPT